MDTSFITRIQNMLLGLDSTGIHRDSENYHTVLVNPIISAGKDMTKDIAGKIADVGSNTGNLMFAEGIKEQIAYEKEIWIAGDSLEGVDKPTVIMPSANFMIHGSDNFIVYNHPLLHDRSTLEDIP